MTLLRMKWSWKKTVIKAHGRMPSCRAQQTGAPVRTTSRFHPCVCRRTLTYVASFPLNAQCLDYSFISECFTG